MGATLDLLREMFPGKAMLTADDVAKVLGRDGNRAGREAVTAGLRRGDLLPGLRKVMGRWLVPITALADWIDGLAEPAQVSAPPVGPAPRSVASQPRHAMDAPRRGRLPNKVREAQRRARANHFMGEVLALLEAKSLRATLQSV
ncbi:hypothetical protein [Tahibacter harae]|uniref:DNA-binding protein n=1 Tax=Tahibacter harae TaxID=2963937 RepID=A0ABT1QMU2_9GAMM|nr:hypothetical protein [Tahibacter harae]MCQ4163855.1 hypothetical protein [Tahibacter harae]